MDISQITDYLFIAAHPGVEEAQAIEDFNVRLIINMIFHHPAEVYKRPPFRLLTLRTFDSIFLPIPIYMLMRGVETALPIIEAGEGVLIYCREGRHRSVAMASCVLIGKEYRADAAMALIKERRQVADPYAWHIERRIRKFEKVWNDRVGGSS
jgi:protein tyrosine phosphatase (PTP) superfamily phosphohydrolase (DUF442 family)